MRGESGISKKGLLVCGTFPTQTWLREMEEIKLNPLHVSRAREKGAEGHLSLSLYQKGFFKTSSRALGSRRARRTLNLST